MLQHAHEAVDQRFENQSHYGMCFVELSNRHVNCKCVLTLHVSYNADCEVE